MSDAYHKSRFTHDTRRDVLWETLWSSWFSRFIRAEDTVLDLGAGYGNFINTVVASRRIALDSWPGFAGHLAPGVEAICSSVTDLSAIADSSIDFALASNLFEHLTREELALVLSQLRTKLSARGALTILQPNFRYASAEYFDDYTHLTAWSHVSLADFLTANGFTVVDVHPRFLPLTVKSGLPVWPSLIRLYLRLPVRPFGKQMLIRARASG